MPMKVEKIEYQELVPGDIIHKHVALYQCDMLYQVTAPMVEDDNTDGFFLPVLGVENTAPYYADGTFSFKAKEDSFEMLEVPNPTETVFRIGKN